MKLSELIIESWSQKYKRSIDCSHPKGFSQKAHCAGKKKHNESIDNVMEMTCPDCGMCQTHGDHSKDKLDELKCWSGFHRVAGTKAGFPGSCAKNKTNEEGVAEGKVKLYTDPDYFGAEVDDTGFDSLPVANISADRLVGFEPDAKMNQPKSKANVEKIVAGLKKGDKLPPLLVRKYKNGYQVLDGHHRFWAYKLLGTKSIPAQIVPAEDIEEIGKQSVTEEKCPECNGPMFSEMIMNEKKDACYYKVKSRYKVWPSAYASGALVKCRNKGASNWGNGGKSNESVEEIEENLHKWFKEKWVRFGPDGKIRGDCARGDDSEGKPKCLPQSKAHSLGKKGRASAAARKRREDPNPERSGQAINVATKKKQNENLDQGVAEVTKKSAIKQYTDIQNYKPNFKTKPKSDTEEFLKITVTNPKKQGVAEGSLEEVDRRGFLKGLGAAAVAGAAGSAKAYDMKQGMLDGPQEAGALINALDLYYFCKYEDVNPTIGNAIKVAIGKFSRLPGGKENLNFVYPQRKGMMDDLKVRDPRNYQLIFQRSIRDARKTIDDIASIAEFNESVEQGMAEGENWSKYNHKRVGGMSKKSVKSYRRSHPGSKIQTAVTTKPSKLKKGSKAAKRRASFCARMRGMKKHRTGAKTARDPNSNINKSLRRWHCESIEELQQLVMIAEQKINETKKLKQEEKPKELIEYTEQLNNIIKLSGLKK